MDLTSLTEDELQQLANVGNFAAMAELARRSNPGNTMQDMTAIERENIREAIRRNLVTDRQGDVTTFDIPEDEDIDMDAYSDSELMESDTTSSRGILDILKMLGQGALGFATDIPFIGQGITGLANMLGDTFKGSRFYNPRTASGNRLFAPGARAGDAVGLGFRRDANRFTNMLNRLSQGKKIGQSNLTQIMGPARLGLTGIDVGGMADSIAQSAKTGYGVGDVGGGDTGLGAGGGGRDYSSSPGAMAGDMEYGEE